MQAQVATGTRQQATEILSTPPRSGSFSVYSQKLTALAFIWLCAIVVWGNVANFAAVIDKCDRRCAVQIGFSFFAWVYTSALLLFNYLTEKNVLSRDGFFSHGLEVQWIGSLAVLWVPVVVSTSTIPGSGSGITPFLAIWFSWGGFFGTLYATYKAYHSFKEEDLPSALPEGYDEADYVYG